MKASSLLRDTTHLSIGMSLRLVIQAAYFVLLARSLGPDAYGAFVAVVAMAGVLAPFSGMGTANLFIKNVRSHKREAAVCWGNGMLLTLLSGTLFTALVVGLVYLFHLKTGPFVVIVVCISDLVFMKVTELAAFGFAASNRMKQTSIQSVVISLLRLSGISALLEVVQQVTLHRWVLVYLLTGVLGMIYAVWKGSQLWGRPSIDLPALREDVAEGVFFSIGSSATTVYNDIDKIMLSKLSDLASTGVYAAAYRVIDVSLTPVRSLVSAAYPQFFQRGVGGMRATYPYALSLIAKASGYGILTFAGLWILAPVLPHILGSKYDAVVHGPPLAGAYTLPAVLPRLPRGCAFRCGISALAHGHPSNCGLDQYWSQPANPAALLLARGCLDESRLRWIAGSNVLVHRSLLPSPRGTWARLRLVTRSAVTGERAARPASTSTSKPGTNFSG